MSFDSQKRVVVVNGEEIKVSKEKPEIYDLLVKKYGISWDDGIVITYGDTVHCKLDLSRDVLIHELVHIKQQKEMTKELWWREYLARPEFRLGQELEAYRKQWRFIQENVKDRNTLFRERMRLAGDLSSSIYGGLVSHQEAERIITQ